MELELTPALLPPSSVQPGTGRASEQPLKEAGKLRGPFLPPLGRDEGQNTVSCCVCDTGFQAPGGLTSG